MATTLMSNIEGKTGEERALAEESLTHVTNCHQEALLPTITHCSFVGDGEMVEQGSSVPSGKMMGKSGVEDQLDTNEDFGVSSFLRRKPVIADVKIIKAEGGVRTSRFLVPPEGPPKESWSAEAIHRLDILSDLNDDDFNFRFRNNTSSFVNPANANAKQSVYIDLGEYQTLLKHSDVEEGEMGERMYSLPQPLSYSDDTMKAVQNITQKFDSFKLRQMRVRSFREATGCSRRRSSNTSGRRESAASVGEAAVERRESGNVDGMGSMPSREMHNVEECGVLTERDIYRIEVFYSGGEAEVFVCRCLADVFMGAAATAAAAAKANEEAYHWVQIHTGVPVLLLNTGAGIRPRELVLLIAQRDTALPLWQDKINYLSGYRESAPGVHTMKVSGSLSKAVQLRMVDFEAAKTFLDRFAEMTSDPDDELWKISADQGQGQAKGDRRLQKKRKPKTQTLRIRTRNLTKADISQPCNSTHLTNVDAKDQNIRAAFGDLLPAIRNLIQTADRKENPDEDFRPRLPTK